MVEAWHPGVGRPSSGKTNSACTTAGDDLSPAAIMIDA
jgi:hypothetical protein